MLVDAAETGGGWQKLPSPPPATSAPAAPAMVLVAPVHQQRQDGSDNDSGSLSSGVPAGNLLGLATYASDDEDGGRSSRRLNETERFDGEKDDIEQEEKEASDVKDVGVETARVDTDVEEEREVGHWKDSKGKKRTNEDSNSSEHHKRSPRRARHSETQGLGRETGPRNTSALTESESTQGPKKPGIMDSGHRDLRKDPQTVVPVKRLETRVMESVATVEAAQEDNVYQTKTLDDTGTKEHKYEPLNRGRSNEELINNQRVEKEEVTASQSKEERKEEQERLHGHHVEFHKKESGKVDDGDHDNNGSNKRETDKVRGKEDRGRASERSREKERIPIKEKNKDRVSDKLKERQRDKDKEEKERVSRSRRRESDRDRRKSSSEKPGRKTAAKQKETRDIKKVHKKRSSSLNSRGRSRSHSRSRSASGSHSSSPSPTRSGTPKRG